MLVTKQWYTQDTSDLPQGPWMLEPDKKQWEDALTHLPCIALRGRVVSWCGYVGITKEHPYFGLHYDDIPDLTVHGGLTYAGNGWTAATAEDIQDPDFRDRALYYGVEALNLGVSGREDESEPLWWLGFDCAHAYDYYPLPLSLTNRYKGSGLFEWRKEWETYRELNFVELQVKALAYQLDRDKHNERPQDYSAERKASSEAFWAGYRGEKQKPNIIQMKRYGYHRTRTRRKRRRV